MNSIQTIRKRLELTQAELGTRLGVSQGSVSFYENGHDVPQKVATKLIEVAKGMGHVISYDDIYQVRAVKRAKAAA